VTAARPASELGLPVQDACCGPGGPCTAGLPAPVVRDAGWLRGPAGALDGLGQPGVDVR
jgi:hypothetical protein